ncbi:MAG TPA: YbaN family protein [Candidatus Goldiibacteriota bacterium]|nr:YbaN family protein [Candidatus Goldiibacteriota bacterium]
MKWLMVSAGMLCVGLGTLGILLPVLPTTPFLLLAAFLFARSSEKFHSWLLTNRMFGKYLKNYMEKKSIPLGIKIYALSFLWASIIIVIFFFIKLLPVKIALFLIASLVTWHILSVKTG